MPSLYRGVVLTLIPPTRQIVELMVEAAVRFLVEYQEMVLFLTWNLYFLFVIRGLYKLKKLGKLRFLRFKKVVSNG